MMGTDFLLAETATYVERLFTVYAKPYLLYHNFEHTQDVVKHAEEIAQHMGLGKDDLFILLAAAWFHDTGHLVGDAATHEEAGVEIMQHFLTDKRVDINVQHAIARTIMATKMPVRPVTLIEEILCDADTYHLGRPDFREKDALVWKELELRLNRSFDSKKEKTLHFVELHRFYTQYCRQLLDGQKAKNIQQLREEITPLEN